MIDAGDEIPVLSFRAQQRQRHQPVVKRIDRSIVEGGSARKDPVCFGLSRLAVGNRNKCLERRILHNRGHIEPRAVAAVEFKGDGLIALRL
jgi:hypothetical protein